MGMDVYGKNPISEKGQYFRNNIWWWRPLWDYCEYIAPDIVSGVSGHTNDGDGLGVRKATKLSKVLMISLSDGTCEAYEREYRERLANLPTEPCQFCNETGIRTDAVGVENGMPTQKLSEDRAIVLGRSEGWCNGCDGNGWVESWETHYPFDKENVKEFAEFLADSGGFRIC